MSHSTWDLEVHAREMQRRRLREADRARQIEAARQRGDHDPRSGDPIQHLAIDGRGPGLPLAPAYVRSTAPGRRHLLPPRCSLSRCEEPRLSPDARSGGLSQPYAGMVVLARGTSAQSAAQPCAAGDC